MSVWPFLPSCMEKYKVPILKFEKDGFENALSSQNNKVWESQTWECRAFWIIWYLRRPNSKRCAFWNIEAWEPNWEHCTFWNIGSLRKPNLGMPSFRKILNIRNIDFMLHLNHFKYHSSNTFPHNLYWTIVLKTFLIPQKPCLCWQIWNKHVRWTFSTIS
jgi:hypothetical protein